MAASPPRAAPYLTAALSPQGKRVVTVHFPDDELSEDGLHYLDDEDKAKLASKRKKDESEFWHQYISPKIDWHVKDAAKEHQRLQRHIPSKTDPPYKCAICTLPGGTCEHTPSWVQHAFDSTQEDPVEAELRRLTDIMSDDKVLQHTGSNTAPVMLSVRRLQWMEPLVHLNDRLNGHPADFSSPPALAGHSCLFLDHKLFILCGVTYQTRTRCTTFHPYSSHLDRQTDHGKECSDVYTFNFVEAVWNRAITNGSPPCPRMGQLALALDDKRAFVFGGRDAHGQCLNDAYIFHAWEYRWERLPEPLPQPPPRYASAGAMVDCKVLVFGGRDMTKVYGDLWLWDPYRRLWSCPMTVGVPPAARHGHAMVAVSGGRVLIMGGCGVGPQQETYYSPKREKDDIQLRVAAKNLSESYYLQEEEARVAGSRLATQADSLEFKELTRAAGYAATAVAAREALSQEAEQHLMQLDKQRGINDHWSRVSGAHGSPYMDVVMLATVNGAYNWSIPSFPPLSGTFPSARMNFIAQYVPVIDRVLVWGGCAPTTRAIHTTDHHVYVLNLQSMRWSRPVTVDSKEALDAPIAAAGVAVRQAQRKLEWARATALEKGVPGGKTLMVAQAEATLQVHTWRLGRLKDEHTRFLCSPPSRFGAASLLYGGRVYIHGGWDNERALDEFIVLDLEQPDERERRLRDELAIRLERERAKQEVQQLIEIKRALYLELCRKKAEENREEMERRLMAFEDLLSSIPPKTKGPTPKVKCANAHTVWLEWEAPLVDCVDRPITPGTLEYLVSMKGGYHPLHEGMEVLAEVKKVAGPYQKPRVDKDTVVLSYPLAHATIKRDYHNGTYDITYKTDGYEEKKVERSRLRPSKEPEWVPVYRGYDTKTGVSGLVPDYILEHEPGFEVMCCFGIQVLGTDYPPDEPSLMSSVAVCLTHNPPTDQKGRRPRRMHKEIKEIGSITLVSWDGKYWSEGIGHYYL